MSGSLKVSCGCLGSGMQLQSRDHHRGQRQSRKPHQSLTTSQDPSPSDHSNRNLTTNPTGRNMKGESQGLMLREAMRSISLRRSQSLNHNLTSRSPKAGNQDLMLRVVMEPTSTRNMAHTLPKGTARIVQAAITNSHRAQRTSNRMLQEAVHGFLPLAHPPLPRKVSNIRMQPTNSQPIRMGMRDCLVSRMCKADILDGVRVCSETVYLATKLLGTLRREDRPLDHPPAPKPNNSKISDHHSLVSPTRSLAAEQATFPGRIGVRVLIFA